uniref:Uncharacterized protein n=1 Tax=viral metagenome TaxID=1070528 RepID=A0A6C0BL91_9ZZZZ
MDRLAYQNMIYKSKTPDDTNWKMNQFSQPMGEWTSKSKINSRTSDYFLEYQSKNVSDYDTFVNALNTNIHEDQFRTSVNNDRLKEELPNVDNLQRVYRPNLGSKPLPITEQQEIPARGGMGTRNRHLDILAKNKNTVHEDEPCRLDQQFGGLTTVEMDRQITHLNKNVQLVESEITYPFQPMQDLTHPQYNPRVDYLNQQLHQMSLQVPPQEIRTSPPSPQDIYLTSQTQPIFPVPKYDAQPMLGLNRPSSSNQLPPASPSMIFYPQLSYKPPATISVPSRPASQKVQSKKRIPTKKLKRM